MYIYVDVLLIISIILVIVRFYYEFLHTTVCLCVFFFILTGLPYTTQTCII